MNLTSLDEFKDRFFPESKYPSLSTLRRLCEKKQLASRKLGKRWFIDTDDFVSNGDPLLKKILDAKAA